MKESLIDPTPPTMSRLAALFILDSLKGFGPQKFKQIHLANIEASEILSNPQLLPFTGKTGDSLKEQLYKIDKSLIADCHSRAEKQIKIAKETGSLIITYSHPLYPKILFESNNAVPVLYARGDLSVLASPKVLACVGSRNLREPYRAAHEKFAGIGSADGFTISSGFATGADRVGHEAAIQYGGSTICVMPSGLDFPFPPENKDLWNKFLDTPRAVFVSEFPFGTRAKALTLQKRNKTIVGIALGVLISQTSKSGGAMNAYRFAADQKKPIATFEHDFTPDTDGNLEIATDQKNNCTAFKFGNEGEYLKWLHQL